MHVDTILRFPADSHSQIQSPFDACQELSLFPMAEKITAILWENNLIQECRILCNGNIHGRILLQIDYESQNILHKHFALTLCFNMFGGELRKDDGIHPHLGD